MSSDSRQLAVQQPRRLVVDVVRAAGIFLRHTEQRWQQACIKSGGGNERSTTPLLSPFGGCVIIKSFLAL